MSTFNQPEQRSQPRGLTTVMLVGLPIGLAQELIAEAQAWRKVCWAPAQRCCWADYQTPDLIVVNLDDPRALDLISTVREKFRDSAVATITALVSAWRITEAVRRGASTVIARPTTLGQIVAAAYPGVRPDVQASCESFDTAIAKYLTQVVTETGSIAGAARRLRLDRTSLKRMLRKERLKI